MCQPKTCCSCGAWLPKAWLPASLCSSVQWGWDGNSWLPPLKSSRAPWLGWKISFLISCITLVLCASVSSSANAANKSNCLTGRWQALGQTVRVKCLLPSVSRWPRDLRGGNNNHPMLQEENLSTISCTRTVLAVGFQPPTSPQEGLLFLSLAHEENKLQRRDLPRVICLIFICCCSKSPCLSAYSCIHLLPFSLLGSAGPLLQVSGC